MHKTQEERKKGKEIIKKIEKNEVPMLTILKKHRQTSNKHVFFSEIVDLIIRSLNKLMPVLIQKSYCHKLIVKRLYDNKYLH